MQTGGEDRREPDPDGEWHERRVDHRGDEEHERGRQPAVEPVERPARLAPDHRAGASIEIGGGDEKHARDDRSRHEQRRLEVRPAGQAAGELERPAEREHPRREADEPSLSGRIAHEREHRAHRERADEAFRDRADDDVRVDHARLDETDAEVEGRREKRERGRADGRRRRARTHEQEHAGDHEHERARQRGPEDGHGADGKRGLVSLARVLEDDAHALRAACQLDDDRDQVDGADAA